MTSSHLRAVARGLAFAFADFNGDGRQDLGVFALVPGGPFTPYVWLRPDKPATAQPDAKSK